MFFTHIKNPMPLIRRLSTAVFFFQIINPSLSGAASKEEQVLHPQAETALISSSTITQQPNNNPPINPAVSNPIATQQIASTSTIKPAAIPKNYDEPPIDIKADSIEYDTVGRVILASGKADISRLDERITADEIELHLDDEIIYIRGGATIRKGGDMVYFSSGTFYTEKKSGDSAVSSTATWTAHIYEVKGFAGNWFFSAKKADVPRGEKYSLRQKARFTTCEATPPHYTITASRLTIVPRKFVSATNAILWVGKVPVFYLPYWWKGIGPGKLNVKVEPGYNSIDGFSAKTVVSYDYSDTSRTNFLYDYYSKRGSGIGIESTHAIGSRLEATVYLYDITEKIIGDYQNPDTSVYYNRRWTAQSYLWWEISPRWSARSEINYSSDESFNESYFGESWNPVSREIKTNVYFTRQSTSSYLNIGASQRRIFDTTKKEYVDAARVIPSITFKKYKTRSYLGFYPEYYLGYSYSSIRYDYPYLSDFSGGFSASAQRRITRDINLSPYFGIDENYTEDYKGKFSLLGSYYLGSGARWRYISFSFINFDYRYAQKFIADTWTPDIKGVTKNAINGYISFFPYYGFSLKTMSGYNFIDDTIDLLSNEIFYAYKGNSLFLNYKYNLNTSMYDSMLFTASYQELLSLSANHTNAQPDILGLGLSSDFNIGRANKFSIQINANLDKGMIKPIARQIKYERDLHCWVASLLYRRRDPEKRPAIEEIFLNIGLKFDDISLARRKELEQEFYPWRK